MAARPLKRDWLLAPFRLPTGDGWLSAFYAIDDALGRVMR